MLYRSPKRQMCAITCAQERSGDEFCSDHDFWKMGCIRWHRRLIRMGRQGTRKARPSLDRFSKKLAHNSLKYRHNFKHAPAPLVTGPCVAQCAVSTHCSSAPKQRQIPCNTPFNSEFWLVEPNSGAGAPQFSARLRRSRTNSREPEQRIFFGVSGNSKADQGIPRDPEIHPTRRAVPTSGPTSSTHR